MLSRKVSCVLTGLIVAMVALSAMAQDTTTQKQPSAAQQAQQQKMKDCNAQASAKGLKGDDRKTFMSSCLSGSPTAASSKPMTQQEKMTDCNKQATAKGLKGDDRKTFMSTCLSGSTK